MRRLSAVLALLSLFSFTSSASAAEGDQFWWDGFGLPDLDGWVYCAVEYEGGVVIGGRFSQVGGVQVRNIARWDGFGWSALGDGFEGDVLSLAVHSGNLIASGRFGLSGTKMLWGIARWSGSEWEPLGNGLRYDNWNYGIGAFALETHVDGLYAAGDFNRAGDVEARGIARWNGVEWSAVGSGLHGGGRALLSVGDSLFCGGEFDSVGGVPASSIAVWNGTSWSSLGELTHLYGPPRVNALLASETRVFAAGSFHTAGGIRTNNVAAWDGQSWHAVGDTALYGIPEAVNALAFAGTDLMVAGASLYAWDGTSWHFRPPFVNGYIGSLLATSRGLFVGGHFVGTTESGGIGTVNVGIIRDQQWVDVVAWNDRMRGLGGYGNPYVTALASYGGDVVAAGNLRYAGGPTGREGVGVIARWDGESWSSLGLPPYGLVRALLANSHKLYAAGLFTVSPWPSIAPVMMFDGESWAPLDTLSVEGMSLALHQGHLYLSSRQLYPDRPNTSGIHRYDASWTHIARVDVQSLGATSLQSFGDRLIAAGAFDSIGGVAAEGIASWNGTEWSSMTYGLAFVAVEALAECEGALYAAGDFYDDNFRHGAVARWDGSRWRLLPEDPSLRSHPYRLFCAAGRLFAGGLVRGPDGVEGGIMRWDDDEWSLLGSGVNGRVLAMTVDDGHLFVGGLFSRAGGKSSSAIARWDLGSELREAAILTATSGVPNPFRTSTSIAYRLQDAGHVRVTVHDLRGRRIAVLEDGVRPPGVSFAIWDGHAEDGREAPAGVYFIRMELPGRSETRRVVRLK